MPSRSSGPWSQVGSCFVLALATLFLAFCVHADAFPQARSEYGTSGYDFALGNLTLSDSRWQENQNRDENKRKWLVLQRPELIDRLFSARL